MTCGVARKCDSDISAAVRITAMVHCHVRITGRTKCKLACDPAGLTVATRMPSVCVKSRLLRSPGMRMSVIFEEFSKPISATSFNECHDNAL
jgi:hypothetical protein